MLLFWHCKALPAPDSRAPNPLQRHRRGPISCISIPLLNYESRLTRARPAQTTGPPWPRLQAAKARGADSDGLGPDSPPPADDGSPARPDLRQAHHVVGGA